MILILAGCYQQARNWAAARDMRVAEWHYLQDVAALDGYAPPADRLAYVGSYYNREDLPEIVRALQARGFDVRVRAR